MFYSLSIRLIGSKSASVFPVSCTTTRRIKKSLAIPNDVVFLFFSDRRRRRSKRGIDSLHSAEDNLFRTYSQWNELLISLLVEIKHDFAFPL